MIRMENKYFNVRLMVLFLGISYLLISCAAVPTRSLKSEKEQLPSSVQDLIAQDVKKSSEVEELLEEYLGHGVNEERMLMESTDYPGTGADPKHNPITPPTGP